MDYKKNNAPTSIVTRDCGELESKTGNLYETVVVASKRADQIGVDLKNELNKKLEEFASYTDNLEEIFENREQIEISKFYERLPKPTLLALQEILEDKVNFRIPTDEEIEQARELAAIKEREEENNRVIISQTAERDKAFNDLIAETKDLDFGADDEDGDLDEEFPEEEDLDDEDEDEIEEPVKGKKASKSKAKKAKGDEE
ncbi:MAG: DNA-directed RNA polymerase subunit omega [Bacteroidales bacterium]|nr:DNA-directed RNA polymerase subunit omega [Bacteroidales bacterium]MBO7142544.1 DNA-directed RNA polymerase subunit omega [Bacteroidales bacterium]